ncbi:MAG: hypothetical protein PHG40_03350 [Candidatus Omnitrophica bacterium]|nr:hypothetical protein [Candidatus Omnitrophota bacterium]
MSKKIKIVILVFVILVAFSFARDLFIKSLIGTVTTAITGAPTSIGGFSMSVIRQSVKISDFKMYNPEGFPKDILVDIPKIGVTCNIAALFTGKIHLKELVLDIKEIGMVKNKEGELNVESLKVVSEKPKEKEKKKPAKELAMRIDTVTLGMGRVVSKDYSAQGQPVIKVYDVNLKKTYKNINSAQQLVALIISEPLKAAGIQGLKVYGVAMLAGVGALPVVAAFTLTGKDYAQETFNVTMDKAYDAGLQAIKMAGKLTQENRAGGEISAEVSGAGVNLKIRKVSEKSTQVTISARKLGLPQPAIAAGVMYRLNEQLK